MLQTDSKAKMFFYLKALTGIELMCYRRKVKSMLLPVAFSPFARPIVRHCPSPTCAVMERGGRGRTS